jgi:hypothetical protein
LAAEKTHSLSEFQPRRIIKKRAGKQTTEGSMFFAAELMENVIRIEKEFDLI